MLGPSFIDARTDAAGDAIEASVCVVGAGAAGLTVARRLAETMSGVVLVESGGLELDGETQTLYFGEMRGIEYHDLATCRLRYFGGTTNHWSGYCRANDAIDYEPLTAVNLPGWPLGRADLDPFVAQAASELGIQDRFFEPAALLAHVGVEDEGLVERSSAILQSKVFQIAKDIRLGPRYMAGLGANPNIRVYLYLNAVHLQLSDDAATVDHLRCATLSGRQVTVRAKLFVLCCHAIENARLLLTSNDVEAAGIGNRSGHVGRYFMDHVYVTASKFVPSDAFPRIYDSRFGRANGINVNIGFTDQSLRDRDLLQYYCRFHSVYVESETEESIERVARGFMQPGDIAFLRDVAVAVSDLSAASGYVAARRGIYFAKPLYYRLEHRIEQAPNPASRIVISDRRDALGSLIADLDWQLSEPDYQTFRAAQDLLGSELAALGWGRMLPEPITPEFVRSQVSGHYHNIGTTRMSSAPADGVVDRDCRVHGLANLYVGGSSVFPSAGFSGPTMMIMGLALRMADHLQHQLAM